MEQNLKCPLQYGSICLQYCELSGKTVEEEEDEPVCASCVCKLYLYVFMGILALFILWMLVRRRRVEEGNRINWLGIALIVFVPAYIVFVIAFLAAAVQGETVHAMWWCLITGALAFWNIMEVITELLDPRHFRNMTFSRRRG